MKIGKFMPSSQVGQWAGIGPLYIPSRSASYGSQVTKVFANVGAGDGGVGTTTSPSTIGMTTDDVLFMIHSGSSSPSLTCSGTTITPLTTTNYSSRYFRIDCIRWPDSTQRTIVNSAGGGKLGVMIGLRGIDVSNFPSSMFADSNAYNMSVQSTPSGVVSAPTYTTGAPTTLVFTTSVAAYMSLTDTPDAWDEIYMNYTGQGSGNQGFALSRSSIAASPLTVTNSEAGYMRYLRGKLV